MSADIVPFTKKVVKKKFKSAEDGVELDPPSESDLRGFINTLDFLRQQSIAKSVSIETMGDDLSIFVRHYDDINDDNEVTSASCVELVSGCEFTPEDPKRLIKNLLTIFDRIDVDDEDNEIN